MPQQILTKSQADVNALLGLPVMTSDLIGGFGMFDGESAFSYDSGTFEIIVGFYPAGAKYVAIRDSTGAPLTPSEILSVQAFLNPTGTWTGSDANYTCIDGTPAVLSAIAYYSENKGYFFAYVPGLLVNRGQIDAEMPDGEVLPRPANPAAAAAGAKPPQPDGGSKSAGGAGAGGVAAQQPPQIDRRRVGIA